MKASKQRRRAGRNSKQAIKAVPARPDFSADEEAFFREGAALSEAAERADEVATADRRGLWRRLFTRARAA